MVFTSGGQHFVLGAVEGAGATIPTSDDSIGFQSWSGPATPRVRVSSVDVPEGVAFPAPREVGEWPDGGPAAGGALPIGEGVAWRYENDVCVRHQDSEPYMIEPTFEPEPEPLTSDTLIVLVAN